MKLLSKRSCIHCMVILMYTFSFLPRYFFLFSSLACNFCNYKDVGCIEFSFPFFLFQFGFGKRPTQSMLSRINIYIYVRVCMRECLDIGKISHLPCTMLNRSAQCQIKTIARIQCNGQNAPKRERDRDDAEKYARNEFTWISSKKCNSHTSNRQQKDIFQCSISRLHECVVAKGVNCIYSSSINIHFYFTYFVHAQWFISIFFQYWIRYVTFFTDWMWSYNKSNETIAPCPEKYYYIGNNDERNHCQAILSLWM